VGDVPGGVVELSAFVFASALTLLIRLRDMVFDLCQKLIQPLQMFSIVALSNRAQAKQVE